MRPHRTGAEGIALQPGEADAEGHDARRDSGHRTNASVENVKTKLIDLQREKAKLQERYGDKHPR